MSGVAGIAHAYEEPPELHGRNLTVAGQLLAGATAFFFFAFVFAYVYLRSVDKASLWHPHDVEAPVGYGTAVVALLVGAAIAVRLARAGVGGRPLGLAVGLALGVAALAVQVAEWLTIGFGPADGGYASVFVGWTGFYAAFVLLALVWVEIQLATALRNRDAEAVGLDAASFYLSFLAGVGVLTWIVLYLA
jgi:heme/copper-type cytochrome/quinol oxidase subunit 3